MAHPLTDTCTNRTRTSVRYCAPLVHASQVNFELSQNSLFLGVNILSRYFRLAEVDRGDLQLAGAAALLIASKHEEVTHGFSWGELSDEPGRYPRSRAVAAC